MVSDLFEREFVTADIERVGDERYAAQCGFEALKVGFVGGLDSVFNFV